MVLGTFAKNGALCRKSQAASSPVPPLMVKLPLLEVKFVAPALRFALVAVISFAAVAPSVPVLVSVQPVMSMLLPETNYGFAFGKNLNMVPPRNLENWVIFKFVNNLLTNYIIFVIKDLRQFYQTGNLVSSLVTN